MSKTNFDEMLNMIVRELDYLTIITIENGGCPLDITQELKERVVTNCLKAYKFPVNKQNIQDGINYYYANQLVETIKGRIK